MKTHFFFLATAIFGLFSSTTSAQADQSLTLVTNVKMENVERLVIQPTSEFTASHWGKEYARVEMTISVPGMDRKQLKSLLVLGLFSIETETIGQVAVLSMPGLERKVTIRGKELEAHLQFHVTLPFATTIEQAEMPEEIVAEAK